MQCTRSWRAQNMFIFFFLGAGKRWTLDESELRTRAQNKCHVFHFLARNLDTFVIEAHVVAFGGGGASVLGGRADGEIDALAQ